MQKKWIRLLSLVLAVVTMVGLLPTMAAAVEETETTVAHVIINQVYGGSTDGYASHSFIELYNPTDEDVDLSSWSIQYRSSKDGDDSNEWSMLELTGTIKAGGYYLIRCGAVTKTTNVKYTVPEGNQEWDIQIHNKGISVALVNNQNVLSNDVTGDVTILDASLKSQIIDLAAAQGNDGDDDQIPYAYEGSYSAIQSKKKAIRRTDFTDTDNNANDFAAIDYSGTVSETNGPHVGTGTTTTDPTPRYTAVTTTDEQYTGYANGDSSLDLTLIARYNSGAMNEDGGSAEIVVYNDANNCAYVVNGVKGTLDVVSLKGLESTSSVTKLEGTEINIQSLVEGKDSSFTYGDMTSVAVSPNGKQVAVALQAEDYTAAGRVVLFDCNNDGTLIFSGMATTGVQPDMVTFNEYGTLLLTADEGEPREGYSDEDAEDPKGSVTIITVSDMSATVVDFTAYDTTEARAELVDAGIVLKTGTDPSVDLEPEYIAVSGNTAYVALQEANAIAVLDLTTQKFTGIYSVGFEDYSKIAIDIDKSDKTYDPENYDDLYGIRMPDGICVYTVGDTTYLLTANEGDSRAWPEDTEKDTNEKEDTTSPSGKITLKKNVTWFDVSQYDGLEDGVDYLFGGRSFTIFKVTDNGLEEVFDSGSDFESITAELISENFNCSNDDISIEDRSGKKGPEPETVITGTVDGKTYAFIALERIGGIMVYDVTDPENAAYVNYINSRDFSDDVVDDVSPEGLKFIPASESPTGEALLLAACEVSGTVAVYELTSNVVETETWTVTFESNSGSEVTSQTVADGRTAEEPADPTKDGYFFGGWYTDSELTEAYDFSEPVTQDITLYAKWEEQTFVDVSTDDETLRLVISYTITVPKALEDNEKLNTEGKITSELILSVQSVNADISADNIVIYDVTLYYIDSTTGKWTDVTESYFNDHSSLLVTLPYPDGTNGTDYSFIVSHMFTTGDKAGTIEICSPVTCTESGIQFEVTNLCPICIGYIKKAASPTHTNVEDIAHRITVADTTHGTITVSDTRAYEGDKVTITVTPDDGYELDELIVTDAYGDELTLRDKGDGVYTFTMPDSRVTITATFVKVAEEASEVLGTLIKVVPSTPFTDITTSRFKNAIAYVYDAGLMDGMTATTFEPDSTLTRGMVVTVLYRLAGEPAISGSSAFTDVEDGQWYTYAIIWATENGIVNGYGNGNFGPNDEVTREQLAAIFYRYCVANSIYVGNTFALNGFTDNADVSAYAVTAMEWAVANSILVSRTTAMLDPTAAATRAEVAQALYILIK